MARIDVPDGPGLERIRLLMMQPDIAVGMGAYFYSGNVTRPF